MWDHIINIHPSKLLHTKIKESRINEHKKIKIKNWKRKINIFYLIIFLQDFLKSWKNIYKNDYQ